MTSSTTKLSLKLLIDIKNEKVLYAEASKSVIDFLFNLLRLPTSAVVKLLGTNIVGSIGNLYDSVENLDQIYLQPDQTKDVLLNLGDQGSSTEISGFLTQNNDNEEDNDKRTKLYMCPNKCKFEVTNDNTTRCNSVNAEVISSTPSLKYNSSCSKCKSGKRRKGKCSKERRSIKSGFAEDIASLKVMDNKPPSPVYRVCGKYMSCEVNYIGNMKVGEKGASKNKNGFVKDDVTFLVMDDLLIQPISLSTISSTITLLNNLNVEEIGTMQEKVVEMGLDEGIKLLEASLQSKMVLTTVFIQNKKKK